MRWEYRRVLTFTDVEKLGLEGWELVAASNGVYFLKRELVIEEKDGD